MWLYKQPLHLLCQHHKEKWATENHEITIVLFGNTDFLLSSNSTYRPPIPTHPSPLSPSVLLLSCSAFSAHFPPFLPHISSFRIRLSLRVLFTHKHATHVSSLFLFWITPLLLVRVFSLLPAFHREGDGILKSCQGLSLHRALMSLRCCESKCAHTQTYTLTRHLCITRQPAPTSSCTHINIQYHCSLDCKNGTGMFIFLLCFHVIASSCSPNGNICPFLQQRISFFGCCVSRKLRLKKNCLWPDRLQVMIKHFWISLQGIHWHGSACTHTDSHLFSW